MTATGLVLVPPLQTGISLFFWSQVLETGEEGAGEQVVSEGHGCHVPVKTEKGRGRAEALVPDSKFLPHLEKSIGHRPPGTSWPEQPLTLLVSVSTERAGLFPGA